MIVFVSDPQMISSISEQVGAIPLIYNYTSLYSGIASDNIYALTNHMRTINATGLPPNQFIESLEYDIAFAKAILTIPDMYEALMKIVINNYEGRLVVILVTRDPYRDALMESLIKFIQQRYGYNCWIINDYDDIESLQESNYSPEGLLTIQADIERYREMYAYGEVDNPILSSVCVE